jgi:Protein of unknown function (DUF3443)
VNCANLRALIAWLAPLMLAACFGGSGGSSAVAPPVANANVVSLIVDTGPAAAAGQINHAYISVKVCAAGSTSNCATIDHVLVDTGSVGLRLVSSVLTAQSVTLASSTDAQGRTLEECVAFGGGQTWGPVALADVTLAGESASKVPVQVMDDTGSSAPAPVGCGANGTLINSVAGFGANGVIGLGVFSQDCGASCVAPATPLAFYYGCTSAGVCTAENVALTSQVANVVAMFSSDNNGVLINLPNLVNANGDAEVQGELIFGLSTQSDNMLPATGLTVLGADGNGDFTATYNGSSTVLPALIDSGTDSYAFNDPTIAVCASGAFVGYYCPAVAPQSLFAVNTGSGTSTATNTVNFAIADPNSFVAGAAAITDLGGGGGSTNFTWGMPFFYGRVVYIGFDQHAAASYTGPFYAY